MKVLKNKLTGEEVFANGADFKDNSVRLSDGSDRPAPALWTDFSAQIDFINNAETVRLSTTQEFSEDWELIDK